MGVDVQERNDIVKGKPSGDPKMTGGQATTDEMTRESASRSAAVERHMKEAGRTPWCAFLVDYAVAGHEV
jgi:hypothetical protein